MKKQANSKKNIGFFMHRIYRDIPDIPFREVFSSNTTDNELEDCFIYDKRKNKCKQKKSKKNN